MCTPARRKRPGGENRGIAAHTGARVAARALAAGGTKDEITDVLLAIAPVAGLGRIVSAAPDAATALDYDVESALEDPDDH